jgi:hypothetical protein
VELLRSKYSIPDETNRSLDGNAPQELANGALAESDAAQSTSYHSHIPPHMGELDTDPTLSEMPSASLVYEMAGDCNSSAEIPGCKSRTPELHGKDMPTAPELESTNIASSNSPG